MRVDKTGLDDAVVEDGEAATILISDGKSMTTKHRDMNGSAGPVKGVQDPQGCLLRKEPPQQRKNGMVAMTKRLREPVEDCEEEWKKASGEDVVDSLTHSMKGVSIQETAATQLERGLAQLSVKEEEEEEDVRCASLQSQSSIITVDPPSLPHEEEEEKSEGAEDLAPRGPTAGKPTSFRPSQENFNHVASKAYSSHNLDRFHQQAGVPPAAAFLPPQPSMAPANASYAPAQFDPNRFYPPASVYGGGGKRGMEDEEDPPFKFTRPVEEMGLGSESAAVEEGHQARKTALFFSQVSVDLSCGGNVVDTSLSPEEELARTMKPAAGSGTISYEPQLSITDLDNMLETIEQMENAGGTPRDHDPGYSSENSPPSDHAASPGSSPKSVFSPPIRPPSNMSQDSGIASPYCEDSLSSVVPSPPEDPSQGRTWVDAAQSPQSVAAYRSPPGGTLYHSPSSVMSPPSVTMYQNPPSVSMYQNPPSVTMYQNHGSVTNAMSPPSMPQYRSPPSAAPYSSPPSVASIASPYSVAGSDDLSTTSAPSPLGQRDSQNDYIFNTRREELRDALDVIAIDLACMNDRKKVGPPDGSAHNGTAPPVVGAGVPPAPCNLPASGNLPTSVAQHKNGRPEKLPIAPLPKAGRHGGSAVGAQHHQQSSPVVKGAVPVMLVPPPPSTSATPVTSASVLLVNSVQNPMILVVNNQQSAAVDKTQNKKKLQPILPRPGPAISDSAPKAPPTCVPAPAVKTDHLPTVPKQEVGASEAGSSGGAALVAGANGVRPAPHMVQASAIAPGPVSVAPVPAPAGKKSAQGRSPPQSKMLNIARRLVASMTTSDLQFQDSEGDTYLHVSVCKADKNMVQALLERLTRENLQAMINTQNSMMQTPLYLAVSANSPDMVSLLIQYGADVNLFAEHTRADGRTKEVKAALHCAASHGQGYLPTLQALLASRELKIDLPNSDGHTALHCAILEHGKADSEGQGGIINNLPIIQALIRHGADPNAQGKKSGKTALMYALESRDLTLIEHMVALIDPARLRLYLKTQAFDGSTCQRIMENWQRSMDDASRQRLHACFRITIKN